MYALLSPAKRLDLAPFPAPPTTLPDLLEDSEALVKKARTLSKKKLGELMKISDSLAELNKERFENWSAPFTSDNAKAAALSFAGDTYVGLDATSLSEDDLLWAQDRVGILSGLYGVLRPLDLIQPYRLEMGTSLATRRGKNLYAFWGERLTALINERLADHQDPTVINLASKEYFTAVKPQLLTGSVVTPSFKEIKDGKAKVIGFMAKKARGMMARHIIQNRLESPEDLKAFNAGGYRFQPEQSDAQTWVFTRPSTTG